MNPIRLFNIYGENKGTGFAGNVCDVNTVSPTLTTMAGGNRQPLIIERWNADMKTVILKDNVSEDTSKPRELGYYTYPNSDKAHQSSKFYDKNAVSPTLDTCGGGSAQVKILNDGRIRKLTPREYWRLMGFDDTDFDKAKKVCSNTQLYKQAGNSIVVNVLENILNGLL